MKPERVGLCKNAARYLRKPDGLSGLRDSLPQHSYCMDIPWNEAQPGDLVFYPDDSHVGIVGGTDADGNLLTIHCSGGANGVITDAAGFTAVARQIISRLNSSLDGAYFYFHWASTGVER